MYLSFYKLKHKPFQISTDPRFLWLGEKHEEALATLRYGVLDNKGFLLLTGDVGTGKTTLINALLKTLGKNTLVASIRDPALEPIDFFNYTAHAFGMEGNFTSKASFLIQFERFLRDAHATKKRVLLIIDEAQRINQALLEEVRLLSNIEREDSKLLNIFFVGQLEFNEILLRLENRAIRQRITINYNISRLSEQETGQYIRHRLEVAGAEKKIHSFEELQEDQKKEYVKDGLKLSEDLNEIFSFEAIKGIYFFSHGYPRLINIICDRSLLTGFVEEAPIISLNHVKECVKELTIPQFTSPKSNAEKISATHKKNTPAPQHQITANNRSPHRKAVKKPAASRNMILATGVLLLLALCYFSFAKNGFIARQGLMIMEFAQGFQQQTDNSMATKRPDTEKIQKSTQQKYGMESNGTRSWQRENVANVTVQKKSINAPSKSTPQETNKTPLANTVVATQEQATDGERNKNETEINQNHAIAPVGNGSRKPENTEFQLMHNNATPEAKITKDTAQTTAQEIHVKSLVTFEKLIIPFPSNSNFPPVDSLDNLNMLVESVIQQPSYKIIVSGFTDSQGNEVFNEKLSEFRANTVKSYLVGRGLEESRIVTRGFGSQYPVESNDTFSGRMANRRVEISIER